MTTQIDAVVFDLADVLFEFGGRESLLRLSDGRVGSAEFGRFWSSPIAADLYVGRCSPEAFAAGAVAAFGLSVSPEAFLREFAAWLRGPIPGALELVAEVRRSAVVACLSNTNVLDVSRFRTEFDLDRLFDHCFFSNEIGLCKPDPDCYTHVLTAIGFAPTPERVAFFDDSIGAVQGARAVGLVAHQTTTVASLRAHLTSFGLVGPQLNALGA